jgi:hypothetical protein
MADELDLISIDTDATALLTSLAPYFVTKKDRSPRTKEQIDIYHTRWWANQVDNLLKQALPRLAFKYDANEKGVRAGASAVSNTNALQDLIDLAHSQGGGTVYLPPGILDINGVTIRSTIRLKGAGWGVTTLRADGGNPVIKTPYTESSPLPENRINFAGICDMSITNTSQLNVGGVGIDCSQSNHVDIQNVRIYECETGIRRVGYAYYSSIDRFSITQCIDGMRLTQGCNSNSVSRGKIDDCDYGIKVYQVDPMDPTDGTNQWDIKSVWIEGMNDYGIHIDAQTVWGLRAFVIDACRLEGYNTATGIYVNSNVENVLILAPHYSGLAVTRTINSDTTLEITQGMLSQLILRDIANPGSIMRMIYDSATDIAHFCKNANKTNYVTGGFRNLIAAGTNGSNGSLAGAYLNLGRAPSVDSTDFALSAGWGAGKAIHVYPSNDSVGRFYVTANGAGIAANPTITFTFKNPRTNAPVVMVTREGGSQMDTPHVTFPANNQVEIVFQGTPVAGETYGFQYQVVGRD